MNCDPTITALVSAYQTSDLMSNLSDEFEDIMLESRNAMQLFFETQLGSENGIELPRFENPIVLDGLWNSSDYSRYFSEEMKVSHASGIYNGDVSQQGYKIGPFGSISSSVSYIPSLSHGTNMYGTQQQQAAQNTTFPFIDVSPQMDASITLNTNRFLNVSINENNESLFVNQCQQNSLLTSNDTYKRSTIFKRNSLLLNPGFAFESLSFDGPKFSNNFVEYPTSKYLSPTVTNFDLLRNLNAHRASHPLNAYNASRSEAHDIMKTMYPNNLIPRWCDEYRSDIQERQIKNRRGLSTEKYKSRKRRHGNGYYGIANKNFYGLNNLKKGPRELHLQYYTGPLSSLRLATNGQSLLGSIVNPAYVPNIEQYNRADFNEVYSQAKFFIIKSYNEDDVHKSIKYSVWASTHNGNKKLDAAYKEVQGKSAECPMFLFFSVNASRHFIGVAEMISPVDFNKTVDYWQHNKWNGCFNLKWHIVKDVPNCILKHIIIECNDNKPVTHSRDTQEINLEQGLLMLSIFKGHVSKSSLLDDFGFYEARQNFMVEKKSKKLQLGKSLVEIKSSKVDDEKNDDHFVIAKFIKPSLVLEKLPI